MFRHFIHTQHHPLAMPVEGSDTHRRSRVGAVVIGTLLAGVVGVGVSLAGTAEPATPGLQAHAVQAGGHDHAAMAGINAAADSAGSAGSAGSRRGRDLAAARAATAPFHRVDTAQRAGYGRLPSGAPLHECIDEDVDLDDTDGAPGMGIHWINGGLLDGTVRADSPEVLVYEPQADGTLDLVAVEYVVFDSDWAGPGTPELFGRPFHHVTAPNRYGLPSFYALHAWVWERNPAGLFENMNPNVTCANATAVP